MAKPPLSYCAAEVRRHDPDRFVTALFAPPGPREDLFALYAFNLEIAKTREMVSEAMLGQIRLQWWRETIQQIYAGSPRRHAVVQPLADAIARRKLSRDWLDRLIDAREADLDDSPPASLAALSAYAEGTSSSLVALALEVLGFRDEAASAAARDVGIAWALTGLLRAVPFQAQRRRLQLPQDLVSVAGLRANELFEHGPVSGLSTVVRQVAMAAGGHLAAARARRGAIPRRALPALLLGTLAGVYLGELKRAAYDPFALDPERTRRFKTARLLFAAAIGRY